MILSVQVQPAQQYRVQTLGVIHFAACCHVQNLNSPAQGSDGSSCAQVLAYKCAQGVAIHKFALICFMRTQRQSLLEQGPQTLQQMTYAACTELATSE